MAGRSREAARRSEAPAAGRRRASVLLRASPSGTGPVPFLFARRRAGDAAPLLVASANRREPVRFGSGSGPTVAVDHSIASSSLRSVPRDESR